MQSHRAAFHTGEPGACVAIAARRRERPGIGAARSWEMVRGVRSAFEPQGFARHGSPSAGFFLINTVNSFSRMVFL